MQKEFVAKKTTIAAYTLTWEKHLKPTFENVDLACVKNSFVQKFVNEGFSNGRHMKVLRDDVTLLKNMIKTYSVMEDERVFIPVIMWPTKAKMQDEQKKREKYTDAEISKIVEFCKSSDKHWHKSIALACLTGLRIGEVAGLKFSDFDFHNNLVSVRRTVGRLYMGKGKSELYVNTTKTLCSNRTVPIPKWLSKYYSTYKTLYALDDDAFITSGEHILFIEPRTLRSRFKALVEKLGIEYKSFHSIRHSYASRLLLSGVDVRTTAELLGHSDVAMTLNVYSHSDEKAKRKAAEKAFM